MEHLQVNGEITSIDSNNKELLSTILGSLKTPHEVRSEQELLRGGVNPSSAVYFRLTDRKLWQRLQQTVRAGGYRAGMLLEPLLTPEGKVAESKMVHKKAYFIYEGRKKGGIPGNSLEDWLEAERYFLGRRWQRVALRRRLDALLASVQDHPIIRQAISGWEGSSTLSVITPSIIRITKRSPKLTEETLLKSS